MSQYDDTAQESGNGASYRKFHIHEAIIFCVELSNEMFKELPELDNNTQLLEILESLSDLFEQLVIIRPTTAIGFFLFNCGNDVAKDGIYEFLPLEDINVQNMKKLNDLLEDLHSGKKKINEVFKFDNSMPTDLSTLFFKVKDTLANSNDGKPFNNKKLFLFTTNDTPNEAKGGTEDKYRLMHSTNDLINEGLIFSTFFLKMEDTKFDDTFYSDVLRLKDPFTKLEKDQDPASVYVGPNTRPISALYIKEKVSRKQEIRRMMFKCPLTLNKEQNLVIGIRGYTIISQEKPGTKYKLVYEVEDVRKEAFSKRVYLDQKNGEMLTKENLTQAYPFGDVNIYLSNDDIKSIEDSYMEQDPFMTLLGFRSTRLALKYFNNIEKPLFIVPDEYQYNGSIRTMASLFRTLKKKDKVAILWGKLKSNSHPSLYILDPAKDTDRNEGFFLYRIPFLDEIRKFPPPIDYSTVTETYDDYDNLKKITSSIIDYFSIKNGYIPSQFKNPALQKHFKVLHDYLLQVEDLSFNDTPEQIKQKILEEDDTLLRVAQVRERILMSSEAETVSKQRLKKYINLWNVFYNKASGDNMIISNTPNKKPKNGKLPFNI